MRSRTSRLRRSRLPLATAVIAGQDFVSAPGSVGAIGDPQPRRARVVIGSSLRSKGDGGNGSLGLGVSRLPALALAWLLPVAIAAAQTPVPPQPESPARTANTQQLRGAWYPWDPYQYRDYKRGVPILTGFDVEI